MTVPRLDDVRRDRWATLLASLAEEPRDVGDEMRSRAKLAFADTSLRLLTWEEAKASATNRLRLAQAALANERLSKLFPFTSVGRLCFSRCSGWPYTNDCPAINSAGPTELYVVVERPYGPNGSGAPELGESTVAREAVEIAAAALPANATDVWLGSLEDRPRS